MKTTSVHKERISSPKMRAELLENWFALPLWSSLHAYLTSKPLLASTAVVASRFHVGFEEASEAVEGLEGLGLLIKDGNYYRAGKLNFIINTKDKNSPLTREEALEFYIIKSKHILAEINLKNNEMAKVYTLASNKKNIDWFQGEYVKLVRELFKKSESGSQEAVYNFNSTLIKVSEIDNQGGENENQ